MITPIQQAKAIKLVIFDVDGVLTNGALFLGDDGQEYKAFHSQDGLGIKMLLNTGVEIGIITGRTSKVVIKRMESLGIKYIYQGQLDKWPAYLKLKQALNLQDHQVAYVGDDVVDLPIMTKVGLAIAVANAHPLVKQYANWQTPRIGGEGAGRDVCEFIMEAQATLAPALEQYLNVR